ncbi:MAG: M1 family metallopeptidase [Sandaracinaceae bacterium]
MIPRFSRLGPALTGVLASTLLACGGPGEPSPEYSAAEGAGSEGPPAPAETDVPTGKLPTGVTPLSYRLYLEVLPDRDTFAGHVEISVRLEEATDRIWLHGALLDVTEAEVLPDGAEAVAATYRQRDETGVAELSLPSPVGPGEAILSIRYTAPFDRQLKGLYRVDVGDDHYAFTQFEATSARYAFPSFDEPRFKTPFEVTLAVRPEDVAIGNTQAVDERRVGDLREVRFAPTEPLPTYLVAMAVGPLDVVEHEALPPNDVRERPLPFRGVAARGHGERLAYALEGTGPILEALETYFGTPYPYDKLDIIAVPDFASGAMENAGAITFREVLLLLGEAAPEDQRRAFAYVMAHELAHQWFGNLVTMPWWDDIWLNEAFATWMGYRVVHEVHPGMHADLRFLVRVHEAMQTDSLVSARQIRQPIETSHDIRNAFDAITYRKGGGVLSMFEGYLGDETFRDGIREYMARHRFGSATAADLLDALSQLSGEDVGTPFRTFLEQPGVPLLTARVACDDDGARVELAQSRYLPVGSAGSTQGEWQVPVCVRYGRGTRASKACTLLTEAEGSLALDGGCPTWAMPNADGAGYYRWTLPADGVEALLDRGWARLTAAERLSVADNLQAGFAADAVPAESVLEAMERVARDESPSVATEPMSFASRIRAIMVPAAERGKVEGWAASLYQRTQRRLGWSPRRREDGETGLFRRDVLGFLARTARVERVRREAASRGRRYLGEAELDEDAVSPDLAGMVLTVAVQEGDEAFWERLMARVRASDDALFRSRGLSALASTHDPELAERALALSSEPWLRVNEVTLPVRVQLGMVETREGAWAWFQEHFEDVFGRVATTRAGYAPFFTTGFCSEEEAREVEAFFTPRIAELPGGPRNLRSALEAIRLCAAIVEAQGPEVRAFFRIDEG